MQSKKEFWMKKALLLAETAAQLGEVPIGAVLVHEEKILGQAYNKRETKRSTIAHAEIGAIEVFNQVNQEWRVPPQTTLYVTVEPCLMCTGALLWARVDKIIFGCLDPKNAGLLRCNEWIAAGIFDHRFSQVEGGICEKEAKELLQYFFQKRREEKKTEKAEPQ